MIAPWAQNETAGANLGDKRLNRRLAKVLSSIGNRPNLSIPAGCRGRAEMTAAYRFCDNDKVTLEKVLQPHIQQTHARCAEQKVVLAIQDSSEVDVTRPEQQVVGVGDLDGARKGFLLHELHAFTPEGVPLGTLSTEILNRTEGVSHAPAEVKRAENKYTPLEKKESLRWLTTLRQTHALAEQMPDVHWVAIADSESDIYECLTEACGPMDYVVRACQDRALVDANGQHLREAVLATPVLYEVEVLVRGRTAKTAVEKRRRRQSRDQRMAHVVVHARTVTLRPPWRFDRKLAPVTLNVVVAREVNAPPGEEPIEWVLFTTLPIATLEQVRTVVAYYCIRWSIEIFFRTLKGGCRLERRRFKDVDRLLPFLGICLIVAWRTLLVCRLGRACPEIDCEAIFEPSEWKAVWMAVKHQEPPQKPPSLSEMVHCIAGLGGYVERPKSEPGVQTIWIGMQRMYDLAWAWDSFGPEARHPQLR